MSDLIEYFKIRREMIVHEDHQINHRTLIMLTTQSLFLTAVTVALTSSYRVTNPDSVEHFLWLFALLGVGFAFVMRRAIYAARCEQRYVRGQQEQGDDGDTARKYCAPFRLPPQMEVCLQASGPRTFIGGHSYTEALHVGAVVIWIALVVAVRLHMI